MVRGRPIRWFNEPVIGQRGEDGYIIVLQPTKALIDKTVRNELSILPAVPRYKVFHGDTVSGSVAAALTDYLKQTDDEGQIVFATHQVLPYIGFWANKDSWDVFVDEVPETHRHHSYDVPHTHEFITDLVDLVPHDARYSRVTINDRAALERIAKNEDGDEIYEKFRELSQTLLNRHWDSFVNTDKFHALKAGKSQTLSIHSVLNPLCFGGLWLRHDGGGEFYGLHDPSAVEPEGGGVPGRNPTWHCPCAFKNMTMVI